MSNFNRKKIVLTIRWLARIASIVSIGLLAAFVFGPNEPLQFQSPGEWIGFLFFPIGIVIGMLVAWRWEILGGLTATICLLGFYVWHFVQTDKFPSGPYFLLFALPGLILLLVGLASSRQNRK